jgi:hypothetical protein
LRSFHGALLVRVRLDQAGIGRKALATDKPFPHAAPHGRLEQFAQQITLTETAMPVLREGRVIGHVTFQAEPAEPAVCQVQMHFFTKPPLRADTKAIANEQHAYQQLGINRRTPDLTVKRPQVRADTGQVNKPID